MASYRSHQGANVICLLVVLLALCTAAGAVEFAGGAGEPNNPYQIATAADLIALGETPEDYGKHFILTADIDLDPNVPGCKVFDRAVIAPDLDDDQYSFQGTMFTGSLDGQGHAIAGLVVDSDSEYAGLFGLIGDSGVVCHIRLVGGRVRGAAYAFRPRCGTGGLAGENRGLIEDCQSGITITGVHLAGGLVGENRGTITASTSTGPVSGTYYVGGLVGTNYGAISTSHSTGSVRGEYCVGGLAGCSFGTISASYSTGSFSGGDRAGGLVGDNNGGTILASYSTGSAGRGCWSYVGGLVGMNAGRVLASYSTGSMARSGYLGGMVGEEYSSGVVTTSYSAGPVSGTYYFDSTAGHDSSSTVLSCFWDVTTSGQTASLGGTGLTTDRMQVPQTFLDAGWDFLGERQNGTCEFWQMPAEGGYPVLGVFNGHAPPLLQGEGTLDNPYLIRTADDLGTVWYRPAACYQLVEDIDLSGIKWSMAVVPSFAGRFDGQGHRIRGMTISGIAYLGLFGILAENSVVLDLALEDARVIGIGGRIGGLAGENHGVISRVAVSGSVGGEYFLGGLVGENRGTILASGSRSTVSATEGYVGGLVGYNNSAVIGNSYSTGSIQGTDHVGGLIGRSDNGTIVSCYSSATVTGGKTVGGLVGMHEGGTISSSYSTGSVKGAPGGGLVGDNDNGSGHVSASFWDIQSSGWIASAGGKGKTTAEMQTASTFLDAGWDFAGETANGMEDVWWIDERKDYPHLWWEKYSGGTGEPNDPYQIATAADLIALGDRPGDYDKHFILTADIDLDPNLPGRKVFDRAVIAPDVNDLQYNFQGTVVTGTFDGEGHAIRNLTIADPNHDYLGLFGMIAVGGQVSNLALEDVEISGGRHSINVGTLAGYNAGTLADCSATGITIGCGNVRELAGYNTGSITDCHADVRVSWLCE